MSTPAQELVRRAVARDPDAVRTLVRDLSPIVQVRVARALARSRTVRAQGRSPRQDVEDLTQEVFLALFDDDAKALRAWDPSRGASLSTFVGLVAEHQVASILRSGRRRPWRDEDADATELDRVPGGHAGAPDARAASRELWTRLLERLRAELTPRGLELFYALLVEEQPVATVCASTGMSPDAVYAWRSRLGKLVRKLAAELEEEAVSEPPGPERKRTGALP